MLTIFTITQIYISIKIPHLPFNISVLLSQTYLLDNQFHNLQTYLSLHSIEYATSLRIIKIKRLLYFQYIITLNYIYIYLSQQYLFILLVVFN